MDRICAVDGCGASLDGMRPQAKVCGPTCRQRARLGIKIGKNGTARSNGPSELLKLARVAERVGWSVDARQLGGEVWVYGRLWLGDEPQWGLILSDTHSGLHVSTSWWKKNSRWSQVEKPVVWAGDEQLFPITQRALRWIAENGPEKTMEWVMRVKT